MNKKIFISTGEVSGDLHGSLLSKALFDEARKHSINLEILETPTSAEVGIYTMKNSADLISVFMIQFMLTRGMRDMVIGIISSTISNPRWVVLVAVS